MVPEGLSALELRQLAATGRVERFAGKRSLGAAELLAFLDSAPPQFLNRAILVDTSHATELFPLLRVALSRGARVVTANKHVLTGPQADFDELRQAGGRRFFYETTVGAGLPVIGTVASLLASGDTVLSISGCMSGTLGYICSELEAGASFSAAVLRARERGFTEPDPRADLSGRDVARKALILARLLGQKRESEQVPTESLYPASLADVPVEEFLRRLPEFDGRYEAMMRTAATTERTLRYVATVTAEGCEVGLREVPKHGGLGSLQGPENRFVIRTLRYDEHQLTIQGPGAGLEVTAAGVLADVLLAMETAETL
jgi:homoserine dehydrogenase